jgi:hypothetical protein
VVSTRTLIKYRYDLGGTAIGVDFTSGQDAYNCHSYAWHKAVGDTRDEMGTNKPDLPLWDNDPTDDIKEQGAELLHKDVRNRVGDKVIYFHDVDKNGVYDEGEPIAHSAIVKEVDKYGNTVTVEGKMGESGMSVNHPGAPGYYETDDLTSTGNKLSRAYLRVDANIQKVGNVRFDSNMARPVKDESGNTQYLVIQDLDTGKAYGVT